MTYTKTSDTYIVHELLNTLDPITPCYTADVSIDNALEHQIMHSSEVPGQDIRCSPDDGFWRCVTQSCGIFGQVFVDASPILHRGQCLDSDTRGRCLIALQIPA